jgi:hypothetical protein
MAVDILTLISWPGTIKSKTWFALVKKHIYNIRNTKIENEQYCIGFESEDYIEWANDYKHYVMIRRDIEDQLHNVA